MHTYFGRRIDQRRCLKLAKLPIIVTYDKKWPCVASGTLIESQSFANAFGDKFNGDGFVQ